MNLSCQSIFLWKSGRLNIYVMNTLSFNGNVFLIFHSLLLFFFRNQHLQCTVFKFGFDIFFSYRITNIKASAAGTSVTFTTDVLSFIIFQSDIELFSGSQTVSSISPPFLYDLKSVYPSFRTI